MEEGWPIHKDHYKFIGMLRNVNVDNAIVIMGTELMSSKPRKMFLFLPYMQGLVSADRMAHATTFSEMPLVNSEIMKLMYFTRSHGIETIILLDEMDDVVGASEAMEYVNGVFPYQLKKSMIVLTHDNPTAKCHLVDLPRTIESNFDEHDPGPKPLIFIAHSLYTQLALVAKHHFPEDYKVVPVSLGF